MNNDSNTRPEDCLFISDLDGTLLDPSGSISQNSIQRLNRLIDCGMQFTIATARSHESAFAILEGLKLKVPAVLFNGVFLTDFSSGKDIIASAFIEQSIVSDMLQCVRPLELDPFIYTVSDQHRLYYRNPSNAGSQAYFESLKGDVRLKYTADFDIASEEKISGFLLIADQKTLEPVYVELKAKHPDDLSLYFAQDISNPDFYWLQTYNKEATKGRMVTKLAAHEQIPLERVVVFGDYLNDLDMFRIAGKAVAMGNALPEVKAAAHEVIGNNADLAVINYLESLPWAKSPLSKALSD